MSFHLAAFRLTARRLAAALAVVTFLTGPADVAAQGTASGEGRTGGILGLVPGDTVTDHVLKTAGGDVAYTATAGTLGLFGQDGGLSAKLFYTAYVARNADRARPITFAFNGGPGAASAYLHMGVLGPKILAFDSADGDGTTPHVADNPESWLSFTDLVLVDPVGTGWSRARNDDTAGNFYGVSKDAESLAKAIALYVQKNNRLSSPKYLLGESYGGFRAAKVASVLKDSQGLLVNGIVMLSPMIDAGFVFGPDDDPVTAALLLPSLAAAEMERNNTFSEQAVADAGRFAMTDYLVALAGARSPGPETDAVYERLSALTGIARDDIRGSRGFLGDLYRKRSAGSGRIVSPYDAAYAVPDAYPEDAGGSGGDAVLDGFTRAYGAAFAAYARSDLRVSTEMTYTLLSSEVNRRWDWDGREGRRGAKASGDLRELLSVIPPFRLLVAHGYSDAITPFGVSRYILDHLPPNLSRDRTALNVYRGGHMFYTNAGSRRALLEDARTFFRTGP